MSTTAISNAITLVLADNLVPSVIISANVGDTICSATKVVFTALPTNGGSSPSYVWRKNGVAVGTASAMYATNTLLKTDTITCAMTSSITCSLPAIAISNGIRIFVNRTPVQAVIISSTSGSGFCLGSTVTFTATPIDGGDSPGFQWRKNGLPTAPATPIMPPPITIASHASLLVPPPPLA